MFFRITAVAAVAFVTLAGSAQAQMRTLTNLAIRAMNSCINACLT